MESTASATKHKAKYITSINGPILFTAPHTGKLNRGGKRFSHISEEEDTNGKGIRYKRIVHYREIYVQVLTLKFAIETSKYLKSKLKKDQMGSFCFWTKDHKYN